MKRALLAGLLLAVALLGCSKDKAAEQNDVVSPPASASAAAPAKVGETPRAQPDLGRKLIRKVELEIAVRDTEAAAQQIQALAGSLGGFVSDVTAQRVESLMQYEITVRVPAERLEEALAKLRALSMRVDREQLTTEDVTDKYVDLAARLKTLQATETELRALLAESRARARKVDEIMAVYKELTEIRGQIEGIQGQINSLDKLAALSSIHLRVRPDAIAAPIVRGDEWRPGETLRSSARTLIQLLQWLADTAIVFLVVVVPVLLPVALLFWLWSRSRKKRLPRPPAPPESPLPPPAG